MKAKTNITTKSILTTLPFFGFALLLLLSPCKVRNFIQSELGVPQTKVSNKSQTTISPSDCISYEVAITTLVKKTSHPLKTPVFKSDEDYPEINFYTNFSQGYKAGNLSIHPIPLYILYQNFKDYL